MTSYPQSAVTYPVITVTDTGSTQEGKTRNGKSRNNYEVGY